MTVEHKSLPWPNLYRFYRFTVYTAQPYHNLKGYVNMNDLDILVAAVSPLYVCLCPISLSTFDVWLFLWHLQTVS